MEESRWVTEEESKEEVMARRMGGDKTWREGGMTEEELKRD